MMGLGNRVGLGLVSDLVEFTDGGQTEILQGRVKRAPWGVTLGTGGAP